MVETNIVLFSCRWIQWPMNTKSSGEYKGEKQIRLPCFQSFPNRHRQRLHLPSAPPLLHILLLSPALWRVRRHYGLADILPRLWYLCRHNYPGGWNDGIKRWEKKKEKGEEYKGCSRGKCVLRVYTGSSLCIQDFHFLYGQWLRFDSAYVPRPQLTLAKNIPQRFICSVI